METKPVMILWSIPDIAFKVGLANSTIGEWGNKGWLPEPYAIFGARNNKLFTGEQVNEIVAAHEKRKATRTANNRPIVPEEPVAPVEALLICPECGVDVFNVKIHMDFAHDGKLSTKR